MSDPIHLLIVDDDPELRSLLAESLGRFGYLVQGAGNAREMYQAMGRSRIDLIVLDLMLPGEDGLSICQSLRATTNIPIVMLTAMGETTDRIVGLEMGADDYLSKPFDTRELVARIKAVLRRTGSAVTRPRTVNGEAFCFAGWRLDLDRRQLESPSGILVDLTAGEFELLVTFAERPHRVLTRDQLIDITHGRNTALFDRSVDVQVSRLRRKLELEADSGRLIQTVRGGGYMFAVEVERA